MALFLRLLLGHILGDFAFQPGRLVRAKRTGFQGQALHAAIVTACTAAALVGDLDAAWPAVLAAGLAHLAIERVSVPARNTAAHAAAWQGGEVLDLVQRHAVTAGLAGDGSCSSSTRDCTCCRWC